MNSEKLKLVGIFERANKKESILQQEEMNFCALVCNYYCTGTKFVFTAKPIQNKENFTF